MAESQLATLLGMLALLPPSVNRYSLAATAVQAKIIYRLDPRPRPLMFVFSTLLGIVFLLAIVGMFFRFRSGTFRLFTINSGLIMPQATLMFAFWMAIFCIAEIGSLIGLQWWSDHKRPLPPILAFLMGTNWITVYLAIGPWLWSTAAASVRSKMYSGNPGTLPEVIGKATKKNNYRRSAMLLNYYAILAHVVVVPTQIGIFYHAAKSWSQGLSIFLEVIANLEAASSSYSPSTFSNADLIPLLVPLSEAQAHTDRFFDLYAIGFGMWVGYNVIFLIGGLTPFFYSYMKQLIVLSRLSPTVAVSIPESMGPALTSRDPTTSEANPNAKDAGVARRQSDYRTLLMASAVVYTVGVVTTIVAAAVAVNPDFVIDPVKGAIFAYLVAGMFAVFTPFVMAVFTWRSYAAYREFDRLKHPAPKNYNRHSQSHQHLSASSSHRVHFSRHEVTSVQGENGTMHYPLTPCKASTLGKEKDDPESHAELKLEEETGEKENRLPVVRLTIGWNEAPVWEVAPVGR